MMTSLLMKFRLFRIALIADIEKAFLQILLAEDDRDVTRFLWLSNIESEVNDDNLLHLRFRRVLFGASPSSFLMNATIQHHLETYVDDWVVDQLKLSFYSDNKVTGVETREDGIHFYKHSKEVLNAAGMNLRGWVTNSIELQQNFVDERIPDADVKVLGLLWDSTTDVLRISVQMVKFEADLTRLTKRIVCGLAARLFDPLGFIEPFIVRAKIMMQELWAMKIAWDDVIPSPQHTLWLRWMREIRDIANYEIRRGYYDCRNDAVEKAELHVFSDSSEKAYGAVCYLRIESNGDVYLQHVISKSKVAPMKGHNIPRLELMAALLGCKMLKSVRNALKINVKCTKIICWSDSQIVLHWILGNGTPDAFVRRRLEMIKENADKAIWNYCPSKLNPADVISRGSTINALIEGRWTDGPNWLRNKEE